MRTDLTRFHHRLAVAIAAAGMLAASAVAAPLFDTDLSKPTQAAERFADAPDGVDPMVTGPRTASFRQQQQSLGCDEVEWPNVPLGCYPG